MRRSTLLQIRTVRKHGQHDGLEGSDRATTIGQQSTHLEETWATLQPDVVILSQYQNDLTDLSKKGFAGHVKREQGAKRNWTAPMVSSSLVRWPTYHTFAVMSESAIHHDVQFTGIFDDMLARIRSHGATLGVIILPSKSDVLASRSPEERFFVGLSTERSVPAWVRPSPY